MRPGPSPSTSPDAERVAFTMKGSGELSAFIDGFMGSVPGALIVLDKEWRLVYLNSYALEFLFGNDESLIGRPLEEVYPRQFGHMLGTPVIRGLLEGKKHTITNYVNQFRKWFKMSAYSSDFGIFIRLEDVSSEMLANRILRLNEFSVNHARDMVFWIKPGGHVIYANMAACNSLGFEDRELANMMMADIDQSFTNNRWAVFFEDLIKRGSAVYESSLRSSNRSIIPVEVTCNYLVYYGEEYLIAFARDITERKRAEDEVRRSRDELEMRVRERTSELQRLNDDLTTQIEARERGEAELKAAKMRAELYLDLMGHDISNMHQIIESQLELAHEIMAEEGKLEGDEKELIDTPLKTLLRSNTLIENVRKLQKLEAGTYHAEPVDIGSILTEVVATYSSVRDRAVAIDYKPTVGCYVEANLLLKDVFANLVENAVKHSNGPVHIGIKVDRVNKNGRAYYRVAVDDNGPGIPDEKKAVIFHRLKRGRTKARGTGLGLYLVMTLVESFRGRVTVEDRVPGDHTQGARFIVMLPAIDHLN